MPLLGLGQLFRPEMNWRDRWYRNPPARVPESAGSLGESKRASGAHDEVIGIGSTLLLWGAVLPSVNSHETRFRSEQVSVSLALLPSGESGLDSEHKWESECLVNRRRSRNARVGFPAEFRR
jgi:hypothetical protein